MKKNKSGPSDSEKQEQIGQLQQYIRQNAAYFLAKENINSIGIGYKYVNGQQTEELCLQFTVDEKMSPSSLEALDQFTIPASIEIAGMVVPTDVVQRSYELSYTIVEELTSNARKERQDPVCPGVSFGNARSGAGTIGCIVYDRANDQPYLLSNWHVLHGLGGRLGSKTVQPGPHDDNRIDQNVCGKLVRSHLGLAGDCAISSIEGRAFNDAIFELNTPVKKLVDPQLNDILVKSGRTTGVTYGKVTRTNVVVSMNYGGTIGVQNIGCFDIGIAEKYPPPKGEISKPGDSGSAWLVVEHGKTTPLLAGLHFAGESSNNPHEFALACYPKSVFEKLGIKPRM